MAIKSKNTGINFSKNEKDVLKKLREIYTDEISRVKKNIKDDIDDSISEMEIFILDSLEFHLSNYSNFFNDILKIYEFSHMNELENYVYSTQLLLGFSDLCDVLLKKLIINNQYDFKITDEDSSTFMLNIGITKSSRIYNTAKSEIFKYLKKIKRGIQTYLIEKVEILKGELISIIQEVDSKVIKDMSMVNIHMKELTRNSKIKNIEITIGDTDIKVELIEGIVSKSKNILASSEIRKEISAKPENYSSKEEFELAINDELKGLTKEINNKFNNNNYESTSNILGIGGTNLDFSLIDGIFKIKNSENLRNNQISYKDLNKMAESFGFKYDRCKGDHATYAAYIEDKKISVTIPQKNDIGTGLKASIIKKIQYNQYLKNKIER